MEEQIQVNLQLQPQQELPPAVVKVRWKPNEEQLRMLVRLFEEEGDTINKQRIKEIAVDLARAGDCTEANVHNWFHNRKARAKRKQKLMQQNDGESEVDTDVDSKSKRAKLDNHATITNQVNGGYMTGYSTRQPLRLPSDAVNLNSRMYEHTFTLSTETRQAFEQAYQLQRDQFKYMQERVPESQMIEWRPHSLSLMPTKPAINTNPSMNTKPVINTKPADLAKSDRSSESKTITDDASTESEDFSSYNKHKIAHRSYKKSWKKKGKGTMIRKPLSNGRGRHASSLSRKSRIKEIFRGLKRNQESYERDLKALFVGVVKRLGTSKSKSLLNRLTRPETDSSSSEMDSTSCSSTASLPRQSRKPSSSSEYTKLEHFSSPGGYNKRINKWECFPQNELTLSNNSRQHQQIMSVRERNTKSSSSSDDGHSYGEETEEFRIVWSAQKRQETGAFPCQPTVKHSGEQKTSVTVVDGKPTGSTGTWWNSILRHSALLFMDISIPHIGLQTEDSMVKLREYMYSKFNYIGGTIDDAYLKKQVAKALNFKRHKIMRMIEQGANRPSDISEQQWDSLIKYYADPKRREKSDKQRAALKALNMQTRGVPGINLNMSVENNGGLIENEEEEDEDEDEEE